MKVQEGRQTRVSSAYGVPDSVLAVNGACRHLSVSPRTPPDRGFLTTPLLSYGHLHLERLEIRCLVQGHGWAG